MITRQYFEEHFAESGCMVLITLTIPIESEEDIQYEFIK